MSSLSFPGLAFYVLVLIGAFAVRSAAGFGAGLIAVPMLAFILPVSTAVSVATALTTLTSMRQVCRDWRQIAWQQFALVVSYTVIGIGVGFYFIKLLDESALRRGL
ncbi:MAG: TSUP family transporter, partial [Stellaceae bacterium]